MKPFRSEAYKAHVRSEPCMVCGHRPSEFAHQNLLGGTMAGKASDLLGLPLCHKCHMEEHTGRISFWKGALGLESAPAWMLKEIVNGILALECLRRVDAFLAYEKRS